MWLAIYATPLLMLVDITLAEIFLTSLGMGTLLTVCQDQFISWNGNTGDVQVTVRGGEKIIETLPTISKDQQNVTWRVDVPALNIYNFRVTDLSTQEWAGSPQIPCRANSHADSTCVGQNPGWVGYGDGSDASSTSATSSASATFSSPSTTAPASSIITSPSSTPSSPLTDSLPPDPTHKSNTVAIAVGVSIPALVLLLGTLGTLIWLRHHRRPPQPVLSGDGIQPWDVPLSSPVPLPSVVTVTDSKMHVLSAEPLSSTSTSSVAPAPVSSPNTSSTQRRPLPAIPGNHPPPSTGNMQELVSEMQRAGLTLGHLTDGLRSMNQRRDGGEAATSELGESPPGYLR